MNSLVDFSGLFKKYRLLSGFGSVSEFGEKLAEKGFPFEDSIIYKWQQGLRVPKDRLLILCILEIFCDSDAIQSISEANTFLESTGQGFLTTIERSTLSPKLKDSIFQVPSNIMDFVGREELVNTLTSDNLHGKTIVINGSTGVGKTTLAIRLGHALKSEYPDGVLWYSLEKNNIIDVMRSIAKTLGEEKTVFKSKQVWTTHVRTLLSQKNVLIVFDNVEQIDTVEQLIPSSDQCTTMIILPSSEFNTNTSYLHCTLDQFTEFEVLEYFQRKLKDKYDERCRRHYLKLGNRVSNLPQGLRMIVEQMYQNNVFPAYDISSEYKRFPHMIVVISLFIFFALIWLFQKLFTSWHYEVYTYVYFILPLYGGILGLITAKYVGGVKSAMGRATIGFAYGLLLQVFGQLAYSYYQIVLKQEVPYPTLGDLGFFGSIFCYIFGVYQLTIASRSKYSSKSIAYKIVAISVPTIFLIVSYYIFVEGKNLDTSNPIKLFLDLGYPFGQSIYISLALSALILSSRFLGGVLNRSASIILCGLITQYVADFMFLYQASRGTWQVSNVNDLIYLIAYFLISLGIASFYLTFGEIGKPAE